MPSQITPFEQDEYRLVLVRAGFHAIWAQRADGALRLPRITIPRSMRLAEQLQLAIEAGWHLSVIVLDILAGEMGSTPCAVVEILSPGPYDGLTIASIDKGLEEEMTSEEFEAVEAILGSATIPRGPFSRVGWIEEALQWMQEIVGRTIKFTGEVRQYNATGNFTLARFATLSGPPYWIKATGEPNVHEFRITRMLAETCPEYLPRRIAERGDWNAWLMEDAGRPLDSWTRPSLERAALSMARLQQRTIGRTTAFLEAGAFDLRIGVVREDLPELVEYLDEAMTRQVSTKVPRIGRRRLQQLASILEDACFRMEALEIPDTLVHNDMNSGNILFQGEHCVFTDWCETGIGNPFLTLQYLCLLQPRGEEDWASGLREVYKQCWLGRLSAAQIDEALVLAPLLAILTHLYGRGTRCHKGRRNVPRVESYARALARRMDGAAQDTRLLEALCR